MRFSYEGSGIGVGCGVWLAFAWMIDKGWQQFRGRGRKGCCMAVLQASKGTQHV